MLVGSIDVLWCNPNCLVLSINNSNINEYIIN